MFLLSCLLLEGFALVIYHQSNVYKESHNWVIHSYEVLRNGRLALVDVLDLFRAERQYMRTGDKQFLHDYNAVQASLNKEMDLLQNSVADNAPQEQDFSVLHDKVNKLEQVTSSNIAAMQKGDVNVYSLEKYADASRLALADVRTAFDAFNQNEDNLLDARTTLVGSEQKNYMVTLIVGTGLGLGALILTSMIILSLINRNVRNEKKIRETESLFLNVINSVNDGIFDYNVTDRSIYYSPSYERMLGYTAEEMGGNHDIFDSIIHPDDRAQSLEVFQNYINREAETYYNVFRLRHKEGHYIWVMARGIGIWDEEGNAQRLIGTHTDISPQKQREEELNFFIHENEQQRKELALAKEKAETANQAKSDFLATMSHEIRTPLNAVIGLARLLTKTPLDKRQKEMIETLHVNADLLLRQVNDLLDLGRIESGQIELEERPFSMQDLFKRMHALFDDMAAGNGVFLSIVDNTGNHLLMGDPSRVQQILINLISNALKFTPHGGITVTANSTIQEDGKAKLNVTVADTGVGIPQDKLALIFDKFAQADQSISRRFGGSGLGLAICKMLVELMGGEIDVTSQTDQGSTFTFYLHLPLAKGRIKAKTETAIPITHTGVARGHVLIVEDYIPNIMVATLMLEHLGYTADVARSGKEAVEKIKAATVPYTAILMDVQMQDMDGFETTRQIRLLEQEKKFTHFIIGVTAHALAGDRDRCLESGMDDYMSKPVHPDILAQKLNVLPRAA